MKFKLIQILLGAMGSALTVVATHLASTPPEVAVAIALGSGPAVTAAIGDAVASLIG